MRRFFVKLVNEAAEEFLGPRALSLVRRWVEGLTVRDQADVGIYYGGRRIHWKDDVERMTDGTLFVRVEPEPPRPEPRTPVPTLPTECPKCGGALTAYWQPSREWIAYPKTLVMCQACGVEVKGRVRTQPQRVPTLSSEQPTR